MNINTKVLRTFTVRTLKSWNGYQLAIDNACGEDETKKKDKVSVTRTVDAADTRHHKAVEKWKKNNECKMEVGTLSLMFLHFYGNNVWDDTLDCFRKTLNVADGSLIDNPSYEPSIEIIDDSEDKRFRATYDLKLSEYINQILMTQAILRNNPPPAHVAELFNEPLIPRMSFPMRKPFVPFNDDPEYDSEDDAKTRKRKTERKRKREEKEKRSEERRARGIEYDEDEEEDSEEEEAPAWKLRKRKGSQRNAH
ncbi:hypothetical protein CAEBREN_20826 [Caenorhabditis brenneri]|uniref:Uncharacterized protein n=1 Tax=Caenorhabditis brenneri TaxID=135651 RepID=G0NDX6_CAEBE|nr:hypothetical protein CAEBREN_20826 [Caenorhabditis brenneri]